MAFPTGWSDKQSIVIDNTQVSGTANLSDFPVYLNEDNFSSTAFTNSQGKEINTNYLLNDANLQGYWRLESDGTDETANNNDLTASGGASVSAAKFGNGADLTEASSQYYKIVDGSQTGLDLSTDFSFSAWVKFDGLGDNDFIISKDAANGAGTRSYNFYKNTSNQIVCDFLEADGTTRSYLTTTQTVTTGTWYHVVATADISTGTISIYINGVKATASASATSATSIANSGADFCIGARGNAAGADNFFDGMIDDVAVWDRALSDEEVRTIYTGGADLRFSTDSAGATQIPHEVVNWDIVNSEAEVHVKVPTLSYNSDTTIYAWYDNSTAGLPDPIGVEVTTSSLSGDANLQGYWKLSDLTDDSGNSNTLTNNGSVSFASAKFDNGAEFGTTNTTKWLSVADSLGIDGGAMSMSCWFKANTSNAGVLLMQTNDTSDVRYYIQNSSSTSITFNREKMNSGFEGGAATVPNLGTSTFHHVVMTYDGTSIMGYLDGALVYGPTAASGNGSGTNDTGFAIGSYQLTSSSTGAKALIDDVAVFNRVLTAPEISELYGTGRAAVWDANYQGVWHFDNSGYDSTSNTVNLTNNGAATYTTGNLTNAIDFGTANSSKYLNNTDNLSITSEETRTLEGWVKINTEPTTNTRYISISHSYGTEKRGYYLGYKDVSGSKSVFGGGYKDFVGDYQVTLGTTLGTSDWSYHAVTFDGSIAEYFYNGSSQGTIEIPTGNGGGANTITDGVSIGRLQNSGDYSYSPSIVDEVRESDNVRSGDWLVTTYNNQSAPATFASVGAIFGSIADTVSVTDTITFENLRPITIADDAVGITDSVGAGLYVQINVSDTVGITDANDSVQAIARAVEDIEGITDVTTRTVDITREVADALGITDSLTRGLIYETTLSDMIGLSDGLDAIIRSVDNKNIKVRIVDEGKRISGRVTDTKPIIGSII